MNDILIGKIASAVQLQGSLSGEEQLSGSFDLFVLPENLYDGAYLFTPTESQQTAPTYNKTLLNNITINPIPPEYIVPSGTVTISQSSGNDVTQYASADVQSASFQKGYDEEFYTTAGGDYMFHLEPHVEVESAGWTETGEKYGWNHIYRAMPSGVTVTPSESTQYVGYNNTNTMLEGRVTVDAIPSDYVGSSIPRYSSSDIYPDAGYTVVAPSGYYESNGVFQVPYNTHAIPSVSYDTSGLITATHYHLSDTLCVGSDTTTDTLQISNATINSGYTLGFETIGGVKKYTLETYCDIEDAGWASVDSYKGGYRWDIVPSGTTITPTTSSQTVGGYEYVMEDSVTINPIPPEYIIPSGTLSITANANDIDVTNYAEVDVSVPAPTPTLQTITKSYTPTESAQSETITVGSGYDAIEEVDVSVGAISSTYVGSGIAQRDSSNLSASGATVTAPSGYYASNATKTVSSGSATPASSITGTTATVSSPSSNKIKLTQTVSNTPQVTAGYISSGTAGNSSVSLTGACTTKSATSYYASTSDQTIGSGTYITGTQTFKAVSQTNLEAGNIKDGTTISISNGNGNIWSVTGTYSGGGGGDSKNVQVLQSTSRANSSSLTKVIGDLTVSKTGTYDIYWSGGRTNTSTSYTWGTRLYVDGTGYGTENTSWTNNCQSNHLSNVSLTANQKLSVYSRGRSGSYYTFVPMLVIVEA